MEFDTTVQSRWKVALGCFAAGVAVFAFLSLTRGAWHGAQWIAGAMLCLLGALFALLSLAAGEQRRVMGWVALLLNLVLPGILFIAFLSLLR
jgi:hypothetical protein